jgi:hypothetical protein
MKLRTAKMYWDSNNKTTADIQHLLDNGVDLSTLPYDVAMLITELDRRCIQLWDKVNHEKE